ncbi:MAG: hypothetical protein C0601_02265 [Candidatus Muiribacterium halophilum]|uniref:Carbamoyltransferase n=1 Tax=Muiribacterium halophilum TaxID=2053465 RepID=A0A2N5ZKW6_MUIH1|nr:MAG: hypothetical protein C0601_02265 [Candidatus Muirbacterium halophilum]
MYILGISCYYHDSAATLVKDGKIIAAAQEERFNREKHSNVFPISAINYCLSKEGIIINDIDQIVFYERPFLKFHRVLKNLIGSFPRSFSAFMDLVPRYLGERLVLPSKIKNTLDYDGKVLYIPHHISHAASAFFTSGFEKANILTVDGIGEYASMMIGYGEKNRIKGDKILPYPGSVGLLYSAITTYLGFKANGGEGKVMALADFGEPVYLDFLEKIMDLKEDGSFTCFEKYFDFSSGNRMFRNSLEKEIGPSRRPDQKIERHHKDVAASLQAFTEKSVISIINNMIKKNGVKKLAVAGGVFLNCVLNRKILEDTEVEQIHIFPAAGDAGGSSGCALFAYYHLFGGEERYTIKTAALGPKYLKNSIVNLAINRNLIIKELSEEELIKDCAESISLGKICGWFQGNMEFGPRALGNRSILANPAADDIKEKLNRDVKHREWFRPYGVSVLDEKGSEIFEDYVTNSFMIMTDTVKKEKRKSIPGALHVNHSVRYQSVSSDDGKYYRLIKKFYEITNIPMVINTSFNVQEQIVCSPEDAFDTFMNSNIERLYIEDFVVLKQEGDTK